MLYLSKSPRSHFSLNSLSIQGLAKIGIVPGKDMTVESALAKLSFVMGKEALTREDRKMVSFTSISTLAI